MRASSFAIAAMGIAALLTTAALLDATRSPPASASVLRLGFFPNLTHGQALYAISTGLFQQFLGSDVRLDPHPFNAGPTAIQELLAGHVDVTYVGPSPTIIGLAAAGPDVLRVIAGGTSGGALFVVQPNLDLSPPQAFGGKLFAAPQLGNTQDIALRHYLEGEGHTTKDQGGDVEVIYAQNPEILTLFQQHRIDGAWVPEPWATRLLEEGGGRVLVDERSLWPSGQFVTTQLVTTKAYLGAHGDIVAKLLEAHVDATLRLQQDPGGAERILNAALLNFTGKALTEATVHGAMANLNFTYNPIKMSLQKYLEWSVDLRVLRTKPSTVGLYDLHLLNGTLAARGLQQVV